MSRITVVKTDRYVCVDGECYFDINMSSLPEQLHAMQWYGNDGEEEYRDPTTRRPWNVAIDNLDMYTDVLGQWEVKKAEHDNPVPPPPEGDVNVDAPSN